MTTPGQNLLIRVAVQDAASVPAAKIAEGMIGVGAAAAEGAKTATTALAQVDAALAGSAANAALLGEANTAAAAESSSAWAKAAALIRMSAASASTAFAAETRGMEEVAAVNGARVGEKLGSTIGLTAKTVAGPILATLGIFELAAFLKESVSAATDEETQVNRLKLLFGEAAEEVEKYSTTVASAFNYTAAAANSMAADFGGFFSAVGIQGQQAADMSTKLIGVVADVAKESGKSRDEVENAIQSALKGRGQQLKVLGVAVDAETISEAARAHQIGVTGQALTDAQKAEASFFAILDQGTKFQGAYAKSADTTQTKQEALAKSADELKVKVGSGLTPILGDLAVVANNGVIPALEAIFAPIVAILKVLGDMPDVIQVGIVAWLALRIAATPISFLFRTIQANAIAASIALGEEGIAGAAGKAIGGLSRFAGFMAGPWGLAIGAGIIALTTWLSSTDDAVTSTLDFSSVIDQNTGKLLSNAAAIEQDNIAKAGTGDVIEKLGISTADYSKAVTGGADAQAAFILRMARTTEGSAQLQLGAKAAGMSVDDFALSVIKGERNVRGTTQAILDARDAYKHFEADTGKLAEQQRQVAQSHEDASGATKDATDALADHMDAQDKDKASGLDWIRTAQNLTVPTLTAVTESVHTLTEGWSTMDDQVNTVIAALDKLAGRDAPVEQAVGNMYKALRDQADQFKLGQQGAVRLDPSKLYNPDGSINQRSKSGQALYGTLTEDQAKIVAAGATVFDQTYAKTHDLTKAREAANKVVDEGYKAEEKNLTALLGSKKAADDLQKAYGHLTGTTVMTIIANTNQADTAITALAQKKAALVAGFAWGTSAPAAQKSGPGAENGGGGGNGSAGGLIPGGGFWGSSTSGAASGSNWSPNVERWRPTALHALQIEGEPASEVETVLYRINLESSGNPNAINLTDSNATSGNPSQGIVQVTPETFREFAQPGYAQSLTDPLSNILAGMNWSKHQYGSIEAGFSRAGGYDNGGWLPPGGIAISNLPTPEPILSTSQWNVAKQAIASVSAAGSGSNHSITFAEGSIVVYGDPTPESLERFREQLAQIVKVEYERRM